MQVKIIIARNEYTFEDKVNKFLASSDVEILDIKYAVTYDYHNYQCKYSAMIMYK